MKPAWYACSFASAVLALSVGGLFAFRRLEADANAASVAGARLAAAQQKAPAPKPFIPIARDSDDYAQFAAEDAVWRKQHARPYTLSELRARGDGTRNPREALQDRVYAHTQRGNRTLAIAELERWLARNPNDQRALLMLARLYNEVGRNADAVARYRKLLSIKQRNTE